MLWLVIMSLLGVCFAVKRFLRIPIEVAPLFVVSSVILMLYAFTYTGFLHVGLYAIIITGMLFFLIVPFLMKRELLFSDYLTPGFVIWCSLTAIVAGYLSTQGFTVWDEFMHWAPLANSVFQRGDLFYGDVQLVHQSYPPGARVFYPLFLLFSSFDEGRVYVAQMLILLAPVAVLWRGALWRHWQRVFVMQLCFFGLIFFLLGCWIPVATLYLDAPVGLFIGAIVVCYYRSNKTVVELLALSPIIACLMLLKLQMFPFILLLVLMILTDLVLRAQVSKGRLFALALLVLAALCVKWSWSFHLAQMHYTVEWSSLGVHTLSEFLRAILYPTDPTFLAELLAIIRSEVLLIVMLVYIIILLPFMMASRKDRIAWLCVNAWWALGLCLFFFALLGLFLTSFPAHYAHSYLRYTAVYFIAWGLFVYDGLCYECGYRDWALSPKLKQIMFGFFCLTTIFFLLFQYLQHRALGAAGQTNAAFRLQVEKIAVAVKRATPENARIFTVWQNSKGLGRTMLLYLLMPRGYNFVPTTFGDISAGEIGWKADLTPAQFSMALAEFDYLLLAHTDAEFWQRFGGLFPADPAALVPIVHYQFCEGEQFDQALQPGCVMTSSKAYLFKINPEDGSLKLIN